MGGAVPPHRLKTPGSVRGRPDHLRHSLLCTCSIYYTRHILRPGRMWGCKPALPAV